MLVDVVESVPLRVGPRLEVLGTGGLVLHGRDEIMASRPGTFGLAGRLLLINYRVGRRFVRKL